MDASVLVEGAGPAKMLAGICRSGPKRALRGYARPGQRVHPATYAPKAFGRLQSVGTDREG